MGTMERTRSSVPAAEQLASLDPTEFKNWSEQRQQAAREISQCIENQVEARLISPYEGGACLSAVWGSVFGYRQFHSELSPGDIVQTLGEAVRNR